jgi:DNA primase
MPIYKNNNLIYYIGRALYDAEKKYETPAVAKERILFGYDKLFDYEDKSPLFVIEGWFDAFAIGGVAILGNVITDAQRQWLDRSPREKIYIPDRFGDGRRAAEQALDFGWSISTPDIGSDSKDMDEAVLKYGKIYVIKTILEHKTSDKDAAMTYLGNYCIS